MRKAALAAMPSGPVPCSVLMGWSALADDKERPPLEHPDSTLRAGNQTICQCCGFSDSVRPIEELAGHALGGGGDERDFCRQAALQP